MRAVPASDHGGFHVIVAFVVSLVVTIANPELPRGGMSVALRSMERFAALPTDRFGATIEENQKRRDKKAELGTLLIYLEKAQELAMNGNLDEAYERRAIYVMLQTVTAGRQLAFTREEALCWDRAALNYAAAFRYYVVLQVLAGKRPPHVLDQVNAVNEGCQLQYRRALAELVENVR
jgi:hypothetical protein